MEISEYTRLLVIVGALQTIILFLTIGAIYRQTKAAKDSERAWVLVKRVGNPEQWYAPDKPSYFPGMVFEFGVYGKTPARVTSADFRLHLVSPKPGVKPPEPELPRIPDYRSGSRDSEIPEKGRVLPPGDNFRIRIGLDPLTLTEEQWVKLRDSEMIMCAYGVIKYRDAFGRNKETRTCYVYNFAWGGVITAPDGTVLNPPGFRAGGPSGYNKAT